MNRILPWVGALLLAAAGAPLVNACNNCLYCSPAFLMPIQPAPSLCNTTGFYYCLPDGRIQGPNYYLRPHFPPVAGFSNVEVGQAIYAMVWNTYQKGQQAQAKQPHGIGLGHRAPIDYTTPQAYSAALDPLPGHEGGGEHSAGYSPYQQYAPNYSAPNYNYATPYYGTPNYGTPSYGMPTYRTQAPAPQSPFMLASNHGITTTNYSLTSGQQPSYCDSCRKYHNGPCLPSYQAPHQNLPNPGYQTPLPHPGYYTNLPHPGYGTNLPHPGYGTQLPAPGYHTSMPAPGYHTSLPAPGYHTSMPTPGYYTSTPSPSFQTHTPSPSFHTHTPSPSFHTSTPAPGFRPVYTPTPSPGFQMTPVSTPNPQISTNMPQLPQVGYVPPACPCPPSFPAHSYVRSPRDFFMWGDMQNEQKARDRRPTQVP